VDLLINQTVSGENSIEYIVSSIESGKEKIQRKMQGENSIELRKKKIQNQQIVIAREISAGKNRIQE